MKKEMTWVLWNLLCGCVSRDEVFGGCVLEEYADALKDTYCYFFPDENVRYDSKLNVNGENITLKMLEGK